LSAGDFTPVGGTLATNYVLPITGSGPGHITTATVTASIVLNPTKTYNGNTNAMLIATNFSLAGVVTGETITVTKTTGIYNTKDVLTATTVTTSLASGDFSAGTGTLLTNYVLPTSASGVGHITKATPNVVVTAYNVAYDVQPHTATYTINGVNGETGNTVGTITVTGTTHTLPGDYPSDAWTFTGAANYNNTSGTVHDSIGYHFCTGPNPGGVILQPINADGSSVFPRAGRTVPVKFTVCDANGNPISDPNAVFAGTGGELTMLSAVRGQIPNPDENQYNDIPDVAFRYTGGMWMFNMSTSNLQSGYSYMFRINLKYGSVTFVIAIK